MVHSVGPLPETDHTSGWCALLPERCPRPPLQGTRKIDWLVIGAGFAGLAAARQLALVQPDATIIVLDAGEIGQNASGRNSGFAIDLPHTASTSANAIAQATRTIQVNRFAIDTLDTLVKTHAIACDWERSGRYHLAVSPQFSKQILNPYAGHLDTCHEPYQWLDRAELSARLGTGYYHAGVYTPGTYLMNPAALVRGLARHLPPNVEVFEDSPVIAAQLQDRRPWIRTEQGQVHAGGVIVAVNAFASAFAVHRKVQAPMLLYAGLTPRLTAAQLAQLGRIGSWGITPAHGIAGSTLRLTAEGRLLIRHGFQYAPTLRAPASQTHYAQMRALSLRLLEQRFPQLGVLSLDYFWNGWMAVSRNHAPAFGQIAPRAWAVSCCNGSGVVRHTAAGMLIADMAQGKQNPYLDDFLAQGQAGYIPPRPLRDLGIAVSIGWQQWRGRAER